MPFSTHLNRKLKKQFTYYLGVHNASWLHTRPIQQEIPLFLSRNRIPKGTKTGKNYVRATTDWALDSAGFTELQMYGGWTLTVDDYVKFVNKCAKYIGRLNWAAAQDWMCEPFVIEGAVVKKNPKSRPSIDYKKWVRWVESLPKKMFKVLEKTYVEAKSIAKNFGKNCVGLVFHGTGLSIRKHQLRTVKNFIELWKACKVPIIPIIQGYSIEDYHYCINLYELYGVDLRKFPVVGVGSICRRQASSEAAEIIESIYKKGINIHGFGLKKGALDEILHMLVSADSMAWSVHGRYALTTAKGTSCGKINERTQEPIKNCANCYHAAVDWYNKTLTSAGVKNGVS